MVKGFRSFAVRESFVEYRNSKNNRFEAIVKQQLDSILNLLALYCKLAFQNNIDSIYIYS